MQIFSSFANIASPSLLGKDAIAEIQDLLPDAWMLRCYRARRAFFPILLYIMTVL